jgi:hypothetical protein
VRCPRICIRGNPRPLPPLSLYRPLSTTDIHTQTHAHSRTTDGRLRGGTSWVGCLCALDLPPVLITKLRAIKVCAVCFSTTLSCAWPSFDFPIPYALAPLCPPRGEVLPLYPLILCLLPAVDMDSATTTSVETTGAAPASLRRSDPAQPASARSGNGTAIDPKLRIRKYRHVAAIHSAVKPSTLSHDAPSTPSFLGFRNLMVIVLGSSASPVAARSIGVLTSV